MDLLTEFLGKLRHLEDLLQWGGFAVITAIIYAETGLLFGFFLPGDSLLFTAGALVGSGILKPPAFLPQDPFSAIFILNVLLMVAAIAGDNTGYFFGRKTGPALFSRPNSRLFKREHLEKTREFYDKHGGKALILARWMPFARTFAPIVAGVAGLPYRKYIVYSVSGGVTWIASMTLLGFLFGNNPVVKEHNEKVIIGIILVSLLPAVIHFIKEKRAAR